MLLELHCSCCLLLLLILSPLPICSAPCLPSAPLTMQSSCCSFPPQLGPSPVLCCASWELLLAASATPARVWLPSPFLAPVSEGKLGSFFKLQLLLYLPQFSTWAELQLTQMSIPRQRQQSGASSLLTLLLA